MTIIRRATLVTQHFKKLFENKYLKTLFWAIMLSAYFFNIFGVFGQGSITYAMDTEKGWVAEQEFINTIEGVESGSEDITTLQMNSFLSTLHIIGAKLCVSCFDNGDKIAENDKLPDNMKYGVLEILNEGIKVALNNPPSTDVSSHLAKEWIPGYDPSGVSTYAVGGHLSGYDELQNSGVDVLWGRVRNIAYVMFVVVMIVIGFMIMFRSKINGQVMVTIGNAIPNLVISLVLVTFSFAIAGLIMDLAGLVMIFIVSILQGGGDIDYSQFMGISNPWTIYKVITTGEHGNYMNEFFKFEGKGLFAKIFEATVGAILDSLGLIILSGITGYAAIKVFFMLVKSYATILIQVIISPIVLMTAALPGNMKAFGNWAKGLLKNSLVFPLTVALINLPEALFSVSDGINLRLPGALVFEDPSSYDGKTVGLDSNLFVVILEIVLLFIASQIPAFLETILPSNSSPASQKAGEKTKESLSKMPLFGSLMK